MTTLAERLASRMSGVLMHPGDDQTEPFPIAPLPVFQNQAMLPPGLADQEALEAGLPSPDFARIYCEAWLALVESEGVTIVDDTELADLRAAAAANEGRRSAIKDCRTACGQPAFRIMIKDFNTDQPIVPCAAVAGHNCSSGVG